MSQSRLLLTVFVSVVELSWLYPWLSLLGRAVTGYERVLKPGVAFGFFALALVVVRLSSRARIAERYQRLIVGALILLTAFSLIHAQVYSHVSLFKLRWLGSSLARILRFEAGVSRELFLLLATFVLWWRGIRMSQEGFFTDGVGFKFRSGILFQIALLVVQAMTYREDMTGWVVALFLCGLVAIALARIKDGLPAGQENEHIGLSWFFFLLVGAGGTLLFGLLLSMLFTTQTFISRALQPVLKALGNILLFVVFAVSYVLIMVINALVQAFLKLLPLDGPADAESLVLNPPTMPEWAQRAEGLVEPPAWLEWVQQGAIVLVMMGLFLLLLMAVRRWRMAPSSGGDVWRESVWSSKDMSQGLLRGLRDGLRQLAGLWPDQMRRRAYSAATVRRIYASLLALAEERGTPRPIARTPLQHLPRLQRSFPGWDVELQTLTHAYVAAHYGRVPDTEAELQALRDAWQRIHAWAKAHPEDLGVNVTH
jgi:hypothetical protein